MNKMLRYVALPLLLIAALLAGLYLATGGRLDRHFHGSISDRSPQVSIHPVLINSGFRLRQPIDTRDLNHIRNRLKRSPLCIWLRMEYDRSSAANWTTNGTLQLTLSTPDNTWHTTFRSEEITTYFQPYCFADTHARDVFDKPTYLDISVVEPGLTNVALIALGPANGTNNAEIDGKRTDFTATYILTANPGPADRDIIRFILIVMFSVALLLIILLSMTNRSSASATVKPETLQP